MKITIPTELSEITLGQLQGLNDIENKGLDGVEKQKQTIELLANVKRSVLDRFKLSDLQNVYNKLLRLTKEDKRLEKFVNIDGVKYGFHPNLSNITTGEFVDLDTYCQEMNSNLDKVLAILYREVTFEKAGKYQIATYDGNITERAKLFRNKLPANVVNGAILFLDFRKGLLNRFDNLFQGTSGDKKHQQFSEKWGWYTVLITLCGGDILKIDEATKIKISKSFTYLSYLKDQERLKK